MLDRHNILIRRRWTCAILLTLSAALLAYPVALAQDLPGGPDYLDVETRVADGRIEVTLDGRTIVSTTSDLFVDSPCKAEYRIEPVRGGFDVFMTLTNPTGEPQRRPHFHLSGVDVGQRLDYLDARDIGRIHERELEGFNWRMGYPDDMYAPVVAAWTADFAIGVALIYDPWVEKHNVQGLYYRDRGTLTMGFRLNTPYPRWRDPANPGNVLLPPGETSTYRFTVRFSKPDPERKPHAGWLDSLEPYREYFTERFGGVRYKRDRRPVFGETCALGNLINAETNPRGYARGRVDLNGWKPYVDNVRERAVANGYQRLMVWVPSGLYQIGSNYPPEFMTEWPEKLVETLPELLALKDDNVDIGMWWGRANQVSGGWNTGKMWERDLNNPRDRQAAFDELDLVKKHKIDEVGLDAWARLQIWERYGWMKTLRERYPGVNFITEAADCDIMHTLAPTFMTYNRQNQQPVLADWLVPGHESWIQLLWQQVNQENFDKIVSWECTPVTMSIPVKHKADDFVDDAEDGEDGIEAD